jgi:hypothetical protein
MNVAELSNILRLAKPEDAPKCPKCGEVLQYGQLGEFCRGCYWIAKFAPEVKK